MKTDFERYQQQEYFANLKKSYDQLTDPSLFTINEMSDIMYTYAAHLPPRTIKPLLITDKDLPLLLKVSQEKTHILIDSKTFYIKDIRDRKDTPFNTIAFSLDGPPLVTIETSKIIMERYSQQKPFPYTFIQYIGKSLKFHQRCPFVSGHDIFIPEKGSTHDSTSWYAAHHICYTVEMKKTNQVHVFFRQHHELQLNISAHSFNDQIERAAILSRIQYTIVDELISLYRDTQNSHYTDELNIVERRLKHPSFIPVRYSLKKLIYFIAHFRLNELLEKTFGEKSPYIDEIKVQYIKIFKKDSLSK